MRRHRPLPSETAVWPETTPATEPPAELRIEPTDADRALLVDAAARSARRRRRVQWTDALDDVPPIPEEERTEPIPPATEPPRESTAPSTSTDTSGPRARQADRPRGPRGLRQRLQATTAAPEAPPAYDTEATSAFVADARRRYSQKVVTHRDDPSKEAWWDQNKFNDLFSTLYQPSQKASDRRRTEDELKSYISRLARIPNIQDLATRWEMDATFIYGISAHFKIDPELIAPIRGILSGFHFDYTQEGSQQKRLDIFPAAKGRFDVIIGGLETHRSSRYSAQLVLSLSNTIGIEIDKDGITELKNFRDQIGITLEELAEMDHQEVRDHFRTWRRGRERAVANDLLSAAYEIVFRPQQAGPHSNELPQPFEHHAEEVTAVLLEYDTLHARIKAAQRGALKALYYAEKRSGNVSRDIVSLPLEGTSLKVIDEQMIGLRNKAMNLLTRSRIRVLGSAGTGLFDITPDMVNTLATKMLDMNDKADLEMATATAISLVEEKYSQLTSSRPPQDRPNPIHRPGRPARTQRPLIIQNPDVADAARDRTAIPRTETAIPPSVELRSTGEPPRTIATPWARPFARSVLQSMAAKRLHGARRLSTVRGVQSLIEEDTLHIPEEMVDELAKIVGEPQHYNLLSEAPNGVKAVFSTESLRPVRKTAARLIDRLFDPERHGAGTHQSILGVVQADLDAQELLLHLREHRQRRDMARTAVEITADMRTTVADEIQRLPNSSVLDGAENRLQALLEEPGLRPVLKTAENLIDRVFQQERARSRASQVALHIALADLDASELLHHLQKTRAGAILAGVQITTEMITSLAAELQKLPDFLALSETEDRLKAILEQPNLRPALDYGKELLFKQWFAEGYRSMPAEAPAQATGSAPVTTGDPLNWRAPSSSNGRHCVNVAVLWR